MKKSERTFISRRGSRSRSRLGLSLLASAGLALLTALAPPVADGYFLSVDVHGPPDARSRAVERLAETLTPGHSTPPVPGTLIGAIDNLDDALATVGRWSFEPAMTWADDPRALRPIEPPAPAGAVLDTGATVTAFFVTGSSPDGSVRPFRWPKDVGAHVPEGWVASALVPKRAPLFAAPAPTIPPAGERYAMVSRKDDLFVLGTLDHCTAVSGERTCLRWSAVIARDQDRLRAGYLPTFQVAATDAWVRGSGGLPRAQLIAAGAVGDRAQMLLVVRTTDNVLHRKTIETPLVGHEFSRASLTIEGRTATIAIDGDEARAIALDPAIDRRVRRAPEASPVR